MGWWHSQHMESHKIHVPNHQPAMVLGTEHGEFHHWRGKLDHQRWNLTIKDGTLNNNKWDLSYIYDITRRTVGFMVCIYIYIYTPKWGCQATYTWDSLLWGCWEQRTYWQLKWSWISMKDESPTNNAVANIGPGY